MTRSERFGLIERMLLSRRSVSFAELQQRLEVSRATLHRDLRDLKERMRVPIVRDRDSGRYRIDASVERYELPGVWFSAGEIHALLSMRCGPYRRPAQYSGRRLWWATATISSVSPFNQ